MSIVRVGLAETKRFSEGYDAIFGKKTRKASSRTQKKSTKAKKPKKRR